MADINNMKSSAPELSTVFYQNNEGINASLPMKIFDFTSVFQCYFLVSYDFLSQKNCTKYMYK